MKNNMLTFAELILKFDSLKGASFISINNYLSVTSGELANHVINANISVKNAKEADLNKLLNCTDADLKEVSLNSKIELDICKIALKELIDSATKNLSENKEDRTAQSQAQTDAYLTINKAIKIHRETREIHVFGQAISKTVLIAGSYKSVNSKPKTIAKNAIKKHLDLRAEKFRTFIVGQADSVKVSGDTIEI